MEDVTLKISIKPFSIQIDIAIVLFKFDIGNFQIFKMHSERQLDVKRVIDFNKYIYTQNCIATLLQKPGCISVSN